ncbi:Hypothetical protein Cul131001_1509 [Corynebacterium ulcerans]|uniref:Transposase n=1 Tax=Corynebacterium ulcerans FRC58 TaxID=1408268 RepID=A0ABM5U255_CORUL|nr:Hypothetical protein Cul05146_1454 [Corynebacterium ulcerans]AKN77308.1 Hypothetical protein CulFRC58_1454 [Corynebacterium ulcerans FRC58]ALD95205.1 Hypothetical protein Cul131001_1509 [Corynebacterium ulcerans]
MERHRNNPLSDALQSVIKKIVSALLSPLIGYQDPHHVE